MRREEMLNWFQQIVNANQDKRQTDINTKNSNLIDSHQGHCNYADNYYGDQVCQSDKGN